MKTTLKQLKEETKYQINDARKSGIMLINRNISDLTKNQTEKYKKYLEKFGCSAVISENIIFISIH